MEAKAGELEAQKMDVNSNIKKMERELKDLDLCAQDLSGKKLRVLWAGQDLIHLTCQEG